MFVNFFCTAFFTVELLLLMMGIGIDHYFRSMWNVVDFVVVGASLLDMFMFFFPFSVIRINVSFLRTLRLLRAMRMLRDFKRFTRLLRTMLYAIRCKP